LFSLQTSQSWTHQLVTRRRGRRRAQLPVWFAGPQGPLTCPSLGSHETTLLSRRICILDLTTDMLWKKRRYALFFIILNWKSLLIVHIYIDSSYACILFNHKSQQLFNICIKFVSKARRWISDLRKCPGNQGGIKQRSRLLRMSSYELPGLH